MFLIVGLGNPGSNYKDTRHNVGFFVIDELAKRAGLSFRVKRALEAEIAEGEFLGQRILLCKPQTFMNASGRSVKKIMSKHPIQVQDVLIVYDDADLSFGDVRFKASGSSAGHNGMQSILELFPSQTAVARIRMGIGRPDHPDVPLDQFVLQTFSENEKKLLPNFIAGAIDLLCAKISLTG